MTYSNLTLIFPDIRGDSMEIMQAVTYWLHRMTDRLMEWLFRVTFRKFGESSAGRSLEYSDFIWRITHACIGRS